MILTVGTRDNKDLEVLIPTVRNASKSHGNCKT